jgi:hypothetical protein
MRYDSSVTTKVKRRYAADRHFGLYLSRHCYMAAVIK